MRKIAFLLLPEFSHLGFAAATEPLFIANWLAQAALFEWTIISVDGAPVRASNGMRDSGGRRPRLGGRTPRPYSCSRASNPTMRCKERRVLKWLKRLARFGVELGGIENGSLVLAEAGLLNGHQVAVHWDNLIGFQEHYPKTRPGRSQLYVRSGERITCAGASAILDMMVAWIGWHGDADLAGEVAEHLLLGEAAAARDRAAGARMPARRPVLDTAVAQRAGDHARTHR